MLPAGIVAWLGGVVTVWFTGKGGIAGTVSTLGFVSIPLSLLIYGVAYKVSGVAERLMHEASSSPGEDSEALVSPPPEPVRLSVVLSVTEGAEGQGLVARITNLDDKSVTIKDVDLLIGRRVRTDGIPSGQWSVSAMSFGTPFVVGMPRTLAPGQDTVVECPPSSVKSLHLLASSINEMVAILVKGPEGDLAELVDDAIRATITELMENQNPAVKIRLKRQVLFPKDKLGDKEDSS
jgi:hypothetical protein